MRRARFAITAVIALNESLFASLYSRLPGIQERTDIGDANSASLSSARCSGS